jgi:two-component system phosphate regulon response regulator PhoB
MFEKLPPKILVAEFDEVSRAAICNALERHWFSVDRAYSLEAAESIINEGNPNFVVIGTRFGPKKVLELLKKVRASKRQAELPILLVLDEGEDVSHYKSIKSEFLECIAKPFSPGSLITQLKILLRKSNPVFQDKLIKYKDLTMDLATYKVNRAGRGIHLGPTEFKIMKMLVQTPKTILSRQQIIDCVWGGNEDIEPRTVDVHVNRLRSLIKLRDNEIPFIKTVRSAGYCLNLPGEVD